MALDFRSISKETTFFNYKFSDSPSVSTFMFVFWTCPSIKFSSEEIQTSSHKDTKDTKNIILALMAFNLTSGLHVYTIIRNTIYKHIRRF